MLKKKKWLAMLLAVVMAITIIPTTAFAAGTYLVYLNGTWLNPGETEVGDGKVTLDVENKTLTIENVALTEFVSFEAAEEFGVPCQVSMEERMGCGVGACLVCACDMKDGSRKHVCKDGPVFDSKEVDWDA